MALLGRAEVAGDLNACVWLAVLSFGDDEHPQIWQVTLTSFTISTKVTVSQHCEQHPHLPKLSSPGTWQASLTRAVLQKGSSFGPLSKSLGQSLRFLSLQKQEIPRKGLRFGTCWKPGGVLRQFAKVQARHSQAIRGLSPITHLLALGKSIGCSLKLSINRWYKYMMIWSRATKISGRELEKPREPHQPFDGKANIDHLRILPRSLWGEKAWQCLQTPRQGNWKSCLR